MTGMGRCQREHRVARPPLVLACRALLVTALLVPSAGVWAAKAEPVGVLPIQGSEKLRAQLTASLPAALRERLSSPVQGPGRLVTRLASVQGTATAKRAAREGIVRAESFELGMKRGLALESARQAVEGLRQIGARFHDSTLWTKAQLTLARAHLLQPPDPKAARLALHEAVQASPGITAGEYAPRLARLLGQVTHQGSTAPPPQREELAALAERAALGSVVWLAARPLDGGTQIRLA